MRRTRGAVAVLAVSLLGVGLSACSTIPESDVKVTTCEAPAGPGGASDAITTSGAFGEVVEAEMPSPLRADALQVSRDGEGHGAAVTEHGVLEASLAIFDADDGAELEAYAPLGGGTESVPLTMTSIAASAPGLAEALRCGREGERLVAVMPGTEYFGDQVAAQIGAAERTIVAVVDVTRVFPSSAWGTVLPPADGFPAVVTAPDGRPGITMPSQDPPTELRSSLRVVGNGDVVETGDEVTMHVSVFSWQAGGEGTYLGSTWDESNTVLQLVTRTTGEDDGLYGATPELVGERVGSQLVIIVPAEQAERLQGPVSSFRTSNQAVVLVVDLLATDQENTR